MNQSDLYELTLFGRNKVEEPPPARDIKMPSWEDIEPHIRGVFRYGGAVNLEVKNPANTYIKCLEMRGLPGQYRLVALTRDPDPKREIIEWRESEGTDFRGEIMLNDHMWDARTVCIDINVALHLFNLLWQSEEEAKGLLKYMSSIWNHWK